MQLTNQLPYGMSTGLMLMRAALLRVTLALVVCALSFVETPCEGAVSKPNVGVQVNQPHRAAVLATHYVKRPQGFSVRVPSGWSISDEGELQGRWDALLFSDQTNSCVGLVHVTLFNDGRTEEEIVSDILGSHPKGNPVKERSETTVSIGKRTARCVNVEHEEDKFEKNLARFQRYLFVTGPRGVCVLHFYLRTSPDTATDNLIGAIVDTVSLDERLPDWLRPRIPKADD